MQYHPHLQHYWGHKLEASCRCSVWSQRGPRELHMAQEQPPQGGNEAGQITHPRGVTLIYTRWLWPQQAQFKAACGVE